MVNAHFRMMNLNPNRRQDPILYLAFKKGSSLSNRVFEDFFDRMSSRYSIGLIMMLLMVYQIARFKMDPVVCLTDAQLKYSHHIKYIDSACSVMNVHYLADDQPGGTLRAIKNVKNFVPWVSFMAFLFWIPGMLWSCLLGNRRYDLQNLMRMTNNGDVLAPNDHPIRVYFVVRHLRQLIALRNLCGCSLPFSIGDRLRCGSWQVIGAYTVTKVLYIVNVIIQIICVNVFVGFDYWSYGTEYLQYVTQGNFSGYPHLPHEVLCRATVRESLDNKVLSLWQECMVPMNVICEKLLVVYWLWLALVGALSLVGLALWLIRLSPPVSRRFVAEFLLTAGAIEKREIKSMRFRHFVHNFLRLDGVFYLRAIAGRGSYLLGDSVAAALWADYCRGYSDSGAPALSVESSATTTGQEQAESAC